MKGRPAKDGDPALPRFPALLLVPLNERPSRKGRRHGVLTESSMSPHCALNERPSRKGRRHVNKIIDTIVMAPLNERPSRKGRRRVAFAVGSGVFGVPSMKGRPAKDGDLRILTTQPVTGVVPQ